MNIYQKLANVRKAVDFIQKKRVIKDGKDTLGYAVVSSSLVLNPLNEAINEQGLFLTVEMVSQETKSNQFEYETWDKFQKMNVKKLKNEYVSTVNLKYTWVNIDDPKETITCLWSCEAINNAGDPAKSIGSALTYAEKYFLLKFFNVATDEYDPDLQVKDDSKNKKEQPQEVEQPKKNHKERIITALKTGGITECDKEIELIKKEPDFDFKLEEKFTALCNTLKESYKNKMSEVEQQLIDFSDKGYDKYMDTVNALLRKQPDLTANSDFNYWVTSYKPKSPSLIKRESENQENKEEINNKVNKIFGSRSPLESRF